MPRSPFVTASLTATLGLLAASSLAGQSLEQRIASAPEGTLAFRFPARATVCGNGRTMIADTGPDGFAIFRSRNWNYSTTSITDVLPSDCDAGPVRVVARTWSGGIADLEVYVGPVSGTAETDLGQVPAAEAVDVLLAWAAEARDEVLRNAVLAAVLADGVAMTPRLTRMAQNHDLAPAVRERALRWVLRTARRERDRLAVNAVRAIAADDRDVTGVRERAIRVLAETPDGDEILRALYPRLGPLALRERALRIVGEFPTDENARWLEGVALDPEEHLELRERAVRVLGDGELGRTDRLRALFDRLSEPALRERALRMLGEQGNADWLARVAQNPTERTSIRERALRILGDRGAYARLRTLYPDLSEPTLRERVIRIHADAGGAEAAAWLRGIVEDRMERRDLRDRAARSLAEMGHLAYLRGAYPQLDDRELQDRVLRLAGDAGGDENVAWVRNVALDERAHPDLRDRAVRILADRGLSSTDLGTLYDTLSGRDLRDRVMRILADRGDRAAIDKLIAIAEHDADADIRRRAMRALARSGDPAALDFLERRAGH